MSKNIKMLFALLATAAVMVTASFAGNTLESSKITTSQQLISGDASYDVYSTDQTILLQSTNSKDAILRLAPYESGEITLQFVKDTTDMGGINVMTDASSDTALLLAQPMTFTFVGSDDENHGYLSVDRPLYNATSGEAALTLKYVTYTNDRTNGYAFTGNSSYDKVTVTVEDAMIMVENLLDPAHSADLGNYTFVLNGECEIAASLVGVAEKAITVNLESGDVTTFYDTGLSKDKFEALIQNIDVVSVDGDEGNYMVRDATMIAEASGELKEALGSADIKTVYVSGDILVQGATSPEYAERLCVSGSRKVLNLMGNTLSLDLAQFDLCFNGITSFDIVSGEITAVSSPDKTPMFYVDENSTTDLYISGDVKLKAAKYFDLPDFAVINHTTGALRVRIADGAQLWFATKADADAFAAAYLKDGQAFKAADANNYYEVYTPTPTSSSSSGCNAGFSTSALALLVLAFIPSKKRK